MKQAKPLFCLPQNEPAALGMFIPPTSGSIGREPSPSSFDWWLQFQPPRQYLLESSSQIHPKFGWFNAISAEVAMSAGYPPVN